ncbi:pantoate--beta-alanine ligase [Mesorhizobium sp. M0904]|uniref:pantoate--beta-alanine ligase n=1 Tax=Mesorhizobium sp. M0904 TaxID=2957022 RepID=UPI00333D376D
MAHDLDIPIGIVPCPTVREPDGLALSSRNLRLSASERQVAPKLAAIVFDAAARIEGDDTGGADRAHLKRGPRRVLRLCRLAFPADAARPEDCHGLRSGAKP